MGGEGQKNDLTLQGLNKWPTFCRKHFQIHFLEIDFMYFDGNFTEDRQTVTIPESEEGKCRASIGTLKSAFSTSHTAQFDGILPKGPYPPCLRMADRALLAWYPRIEVSSSVWEWTFFWAIMIFKVSMWGAHYAWVGVATIGAPLNWNVNYTNVLWSISRFNLPFCYPVKIDGLVQERCNSSALAMH